MDQMLESMRFEGLARFNQSLQARKYSWPSVGAIRMSGITFSPLVVRHPDLRSFGLRRQFKRHSRFLVILAHREVVLEKPGRLTLEDCASDIDHSFAMRSGTGPCHRAARRPVGFKLRSHKDDAVRF